jgi:putative effector of murein hydrolase LrgA (UPF0299 family)
VSRIILFVVMALIFVPFGYWVIKSAFNLESPHIFVMFLFSGSLMTLLGLTAIVGLVSTVTKKSKKCRKSKF